MVVFDLGVSHKIFAQLSTKYTFSERLKTEFLKSTTNLVVLSFILEIQFEMFKTTPFVSEAYLPALLFARASFMLSSIFNILNANTVFPLCFLALRSHVSNFQSQKLHNLALVFIIRLISQKVIGIFRGRNTVLVLKLQSKTALNSMEYLRRISLTNFAKMTQMFLLVATKVLEFTLRVNMTLGDFAVSHYVYISVRSEQWSLETRYLKPFI